MTSTRRALVVEDDLRILDIAGQLLADEGYEVSATSDFAEAKRAVRTGSFQLLLTDVRLGEFNGLQLAIEARLGCQDIRIVVMTGWADRAVEAEVAKSRGVIITKPFTAEALRKAIESAGSADG